MPNDEPAKIAAGEEAATGPEELTEAEAERVAAGAGIPVVRPRVLPGTAPLKYQGPTLTATGGSDVAMESIALTSEGIEP